MHMQQATVLPLSDRYRDAIRFTLLFQVPIAVFCLLLLDFGRMAKLCGATMIGFWLVTALIMARRPTSPDRGDILFLRWGFLPLFALAVALGRLVS